MAKVFTITEGLENLGALKTGGQGSVYKGKRIGEIISAVKILPTPMVNDDPGNKKYADFQNEVNKLQRVNEQPNPNVVKILGSGITETGGFPFIEMEFIEGPDLCELLQPPNDRIFTIKETIKVAEHLAHALSHCHNLDVKHGDIKSNNVKYNRHTGNYVLLDFGLAVMSDEQRRTSLRNAGAIEFMAPEQNEGKMFFQTDVYSFGIILFELLAGQVPFKLDTNTETARNHIMLAHMETGVPDLVLLRKNNLPANWPEEKKEAEMNLPAWLTHVVYKCLEKQIENRFANGEVLYEFVCLNNTLSTGTPELNAGNTAILQEINKRLISEKEILQEQLLLQQKATEEKEKELILFRNSLQHHAISTSPSPGHGVSKAAFSGLVFTSIILASIAAYGLFFRNANSIASTEEVVPADSTHYYDSIEKAANEERANTARIKRKEKDDPIVADTASLKKDTNQVKFNSTRKDSIKKIETVDTSMENSNDLLPSEKNEY